MAVSPFALAKMFSCPIPTATAGPLASILTTSGLVDTQVAATGTVDRSLSSFDATNICSLPNVMEAFHGAISRATTVGGGCAGGLVGRRRRICRQARRET